jgi:hypothetical protein
MLQYQARCQLLGINEYLLNEVSFISNLKGMNCHCMCRNAVYCGFICHDEGLLASCKPH